MWSKLYWRCGGNGLHIKEKKRGRCKNVKNVYIQIAHQQRRIMTLALRIRLVSPFYQSLLIRVAKTKNKNTITLTSRARRK